jgi:hypothetical protein
MKQPPRTFGIAIAILSGIFLFSCLPLTQAFILLSISARPGIDIITPETNPGVNPVIVGAEVPDLVPAPYLAQIALALIFLVIAVFTWRGKPPVIRYIFVGAVLLLTAGNLIQLGSILAAPAPTTQTGLDSASELTRTLTISQLCITLVIPLYIVWYLNRGPARAFFRGHYLKSPGDDAPSAR